MSAGSDADPPDSRSRRPKAAPPQQNGDDQERANADARPDECLFAYPPARRPAAAAARHSRCGSRAGNNRVRRRERRARCWRERCRREQHYVGINRCAHHIRQHQSRQRRRRKRCFWIRLREGEDRDVLRGPCIGWRIGDGEGFPVGKSDWDEGRGEGGSRCAASGWRRLVRICIFSHLFLIWDSERCDWKVYAVGAGDVTSPHLTPWSRAAGFRRDGTVQAR